MKAFAFVTLVACGGTLEPVVDAGGLDAAPDVHTLPIVCVTDAEAGAATRCTDVYPWTFVADAGATVACTTGNIHCAIGQQCTLASGVTGTCEHE